MARTWRGISTRRQRASTSIPAGRATASHSGGQRHTPRRTKSNGRESSSTATRLPTAHSTSRTVMYLGETRCQAMPGGSIASVCIFAFPRGFATDLATGLAVNTLGVAVLRGNLAEALHQEANHDHHQSPAGHGQGQPGDALVA